MTRPARPLPLAAALAACLAGGCSSTGPRTVLAGPEGGAVAYRDSGGDVPDALVLVHGWACDSRTWEVQLESLAPRARVLAVDLPGHGASDDPARWTMDALADGVATAMDDAGVARAVVVGHSNGASVARQLWRRYPERTLAVVVVDGALRNPIPPDAAQAMIDPFRADDWRETAAGYVDSMLAGQSGIGPEGVADTIRTMMLSASKAAMVGGLEAFVDSEIWGDDPIAVPVLALMTEMPFWDAGYVAYVEGICPDLDYRTIDTGHFVMLEAPDAFDAILIDFLDRKELL